MTVALLLVENSEAMAQKVLQVLQEAGLPVEWERAATAGELGAALDRRAWDAVLCEHHMTGLTYTAALAEVQRRSLEIPFIVLAPTADEDQVARAIRLGARDFVSSGPRPSGRRRTRGKSS